MIFLNVRQDSEKGKIHIEKKHIEGHIRLLNWFIIYDVTMEQSNSHMQLIVQPKEIRNFYEERNLGPVETKVYILPHIVNFLLLALR